MSKCKIRVIHNPKSDIVSNEHDTFSDISRIIRVANKHMGSRVVLDIRKKKKINPSLLGLCTAYHYALNKSNNHLRIWARKGFPVNVSLNKDMFGYYTHWSRPMDAVFKLGSSKVHVFEAVDIIKFKDYLLYNAFLPEWKKSIPYYYITELKQHLIELFNNASEFSDDNSPIFVSSSFNEGQLNFILIDCGCGFKKSMCINDSSCGIIDEGGAIERVLSGACSKGLGMGGKLKSLGDYCAVNEGELIIISSGKSVTYDMEGFHKKGIIPGPFKGSIISISLKPKMIEFEERIAA